MFGASSRSLANELERVSVEPQPSVERRVILEQRGCLQERPAQRRQARRQGAPGGLLAVVHQPQPAAAVVEREIALVGDEHDAGALRHVLVVGDVDQQLIDRAGLDPAVEDRHHLARLEGARRRRRTP